MEDYISVKIASRVDGREVVCQQTDDDPSHESLGRTIAECLHRSDWPRSLQVLAEAISTIDQGLGIEGHCDGYPLEAEGRLIDAANELLAAWEEHDEKNLLNATPEEK